MTGLRAEATAFHELPRPSTTPVANSELILRVSPSTPNWVMETMAKLNERARLPRGWDSHDGLPLQPQVRSFAFRLFGWLEMDPLPTPAVVLGSSGNVQLEWRVHGRELDVDIRDSDLIEVVKTHPDGRIEEVSITCNFPDTLRRLTRWVTEG